METPKKKFRVQPLPTSNQLPPPLPVERIEKVAAVDICRIRPKEMTKEKLLNPDTEKKNHSIYFQALRSLIALIGSRAIRNCLCILALLQYC